MISLVKRREKWIRDNCFETYFVAPLPSDVVEEPAGSGA